MEIAAAPNAAKPKARRRWCQFNLGTLLLGVTLIGCGLGRLGIKIQDGWRQQAAAAAIEKSGGTVNDDDELNPPPRQRIERGASRTRVASIAAGQVLDRQDPTVAFLDRLAPLLEVGGPDGPWLPPFQAAPM